MAFKPAKSRSLALIKGKICSNISFVVAGQRVPIASEKPVKSLNGVFNGFLTDKSQESDTDRQAVEGLQVIREAPLEGRFKEWLFQFALLPRLLWLLTIYEIDLFTEGLEKKLTDASDHGLGYLQGCHLLPSIARAQS